MENQHANDFNQEASLKLIYEMIESAKTRIGKNYFYYLFWGYLVVLTCLLEVFLIKVIGYPRHYLVWTFLMPLGAIITSVFYYRQQESSKSRTFIGTAMGYLWSGWLVSFIILLAFLWMSAQFQLIIPTVLAMYGLAVFVSGGMVKFRLLMGGSVLAWTAAVISFFVPYLGQLLILAGAAIFSHIIPGYVLKSRSKA